MSEQSDLRYRFNYLEALDPLNGYNERPVSWFEEHILPDFIETKIRLQLGDTLLDIGCAYGYYTIRYASYFSAVVGIDFSNLRITGARTYNCRKNVAYEIVNLLEGPILGKYGSAVSSACFQHLHPDGRERAFKVVRDSLTDGAFLVLYDENYQDRAHKWDGFYEPLDPQKVAMLPNWHIQTCTYVCQGLCGERIYRWELQAV